jgi:hypothetical protein
MDKSDKNKDATPKTQTTQATKGKKDINNNTAFYRKIKSQYDIKKWKKYPKYFALPPYLFPSNNTKKVILSHPTMNKDCAKRKAVPNKDKASTLEAAQLATSSKKILKSPKLCIQKGAKGKIVVQSSQANPSGPHTATLKKKNVKMSAVRPKKHQKMGEALLEVAATHPKKFTTTLKGGEKLPHTHNAANTTATASRITQKFKTTVRTNTKTSKKTGISYSKVVQNPEKTKPKTILKGDTTILKTPPERSIGQFIVDKQSDVASLKRPASMDGSDRKKSDPTKKPRINEPTNNEDSRNHASNPPIANMQRNPRNNRIIPSNTRNRTVRQTYLTDFPLWSIVSANGYHVAPSKFKNGKSAPTLYGIVQNPGHFKDEKLTPGKQYETCVTFVMSGEVEWVDNTGLNVFTTCMDDSVLTFIEGPPQPFVDDLEIVGEHRKWFMEGSYGDAPAWVVRPYPDACEFCASPWCVYKNNTKQMDKIIEKNLPAHEELNEQKRFACYKSAIRSISKNRKMGWRNRMRLGWCFESRVKKAFPSEEYTGFRPITKDDPCTSESSDDSVIDLTN